LVNKYGDRTALKMQRLDGRLSKNVSRYLRKLSSIEDKLSRRLQGQDSGVATTLGKGGYRQYLQDMQGPSAPVSSLPPSAQYEPSLDTLRTTLLFLRDHAAFKNTDLTGAAGKVQGLENRLAQTTEIKQYIDERKREIAALLQQYTHVPSGVTRAFNEYKKTAYYYKQQVQSFKDEVGDMDKMEERAMNIFKTMPGYQDFLSKNSMLARLFPMPAGYGRPAALNGLQSRDQIQQLLQQQVSASGQGGAQFIDQQLGQARGMVARLQNNVSKYGQAGADMDIPGFRPDEQKTKRFLQRLVFGANLQFAQATSYFPAGANMGLSAGYKINDKSTVGVGVSCMMGMGTAWNHIRLSNGGVGLRSFIDWRIKGTLFVAGGYEENRIAGDWQRSALAGLEKKYRINKKLQGQLQLLYDALYVHQVPRGQMIKFRLGYNF
jgi:hypothetical protein